LTAPQPFTFMTITILQVFVLDYHPRESPGCDQFFEPAPRLNFVFPPSLI
jgi:hypothetical protein